MDLFFSHRDAVHIALVGLGATAVMDAAALLLRRAGLPPSNFALVGRWIGHMRHGRWAHAAISKAPALRHERALGWLVHYATGIAFAGLFTAVHGRAWLTSPGLAPALLFGLSTVVMPWCVMQPAMGAGFANAHTSAPWPNRWRNLANHALFGLGLYVTATALRPVLA